MPFFDTLTNSKKKSHPYTICDFKVPPKHFKVGKQAKQILDQALTQPWTKLWLKKQILDQVWLYSAYIYIYRCTERERKETRERGEREREREIYIYIYREREETREGERDERDQRERGRERERERGERERGERPEREVRDQREDIERERWRDGLERGQELWRRGRKNERWIIGSQNSDMKCESDMNTSKGKGGMQNRRTYGTICRRKVSNRRAEERKRATKPCWLCPLHCLNPRRKREAKDLQEYREVTHPDCKDVEE